MSASATILVVDDDHMQLDVLDLMLSRHGYRVLRALTGEDALRTLQAQTDIDLILLDVMLPGDLDGLEVCRRVRADTHHLYIPVVMVTALGQTEQIARGLDAGADDYIAKPFSQREILARIQAALRVRRIQRDLAEAQHRYRVLIETARDVIFALDPSGHLTYISPVCAALTGYTPETLLADEQPFVRFVHPDDQPHLLNWLESHAAHAPDGAELEFRIIRSDGQLRWAALSSALITDRVGQPIGAQGTLRDITHRKQIETAMWRRSQELAALNLIAARINQTLEVQSTLDTALDALLEIVGIELGAIYVVDGSQIKRRTARGHPDAHRAFSPAGEFVEWQLRDLDVIREPLADAPGQITAALKARGIQSQLAVPLRERGALNGLLLLASRAYDKFDPNEVTLISTIAEQISIAITNARLYEETRHRAEQLALLNEIAHMMTSTLELDKVLRVIMEATVSMLQGEAGSVLLLDDATGDLVFAAAVGASAEKLPGVHLPAGAGIAGRTLREGRPLLINDAQHDAQFYSGVDHTTGLKTRTLMAAPLRARGRLIGVMEVINKRSAVFADADLRLLELLAPTAAAAIDNAQLYARETQLTDEVRRHNRELSVLHAISAALSESLAIQQVMDAALIVLRPEFEFDAGYMSLLGSAAAAHHPANEINPPLDQSPAARRFTQHALDSRTVQLLPDTTQLDGDEASAWRAANIGALAVVPVWGHDYVQGVLQMVWQQPRRFSDETAPLLAAIGQQIGVALERAHLYEVAQHRAQEIERSHRQLVQAEKLAATGRLTMSLAHEINNPLQAIQNCLHLALEFELDADHKTYYLNLAREEVERLSVLVQSMLDFYRPSRADRPTADVMNVIERVLALSDQKLRGSQIDVQLDCPAQPLVAPIAPDQLGQVCLNLIVNAAEAMEEGGALRISAHTRDDMIELRFTDTGPGIPPADLPHIFEPFYTTKTEGTGLGLAIGFTIIEQHGGTLNVESEPGAGATFIIRLPKAE